VHGVSERLQAEPPYHVLCPVGPPHRRPSMTRECIVQVLADAGGSCRILEPMSERMEHTCFVRDPQLPLVTSEPFRPRLSEAALGTGSEKRKEPSLRASRSYPVNKLQKSNSGQIGMYRH